MTEFHSKYLANALKLKHASCDIANLTRSIAGARVDLNPHQVRAALFALQSPLSKGVILADEVGLGKTIEAGLVIAQKWAERKRNILLIVPAFLRKQWEQELQEKFFLPVSILDSKKYNEAQQAGIANPFNTTESILVISYSYAAEQNDIINAINWDLVVIDEAHRLRNVYKSSSKQAKAIGEALKDKPKLLLTATPLQNNLMELYGLVSIIDPLVFGDPESFKIQFTLSGNSDESYQRLRERLRPLVIRTLRKQVQAYVSFTNRIAFTEHFYPTDDEQKLYDGVSAYLQKEDSFALPKAQRQLITMVLRKLLSSSPQAISSTLKGLEQSLMKQGGPSVILDPEEQELLNSLFEDWKDSTADNNLVLDPPNLKDEQKKKQIQEEILELRTYINLAESIKRNSKSEALLTALQTAFQQAEKIGSPKKVVIFTEFKHTQSFLFDYLSENGYKDQLVLINGNNIDKHSTSVYKSWLEQNKDKGKITGSKAIDMKAALVNHFKENATILIATEAAAEGVNLQFCSLLINYDLPWNPQRVEQRIGRCHRYGQKHDVVVINFINQRNEADQRVYELLRDKFKLFDGVFGASDEILGVIESGVDIEKKIAQLYQTCRTSDEIREAFDKLRDELDTEIQKNVKETRASIFEHLDEEVINLLKLHQDQTVSSVNQREEWLFNLVCNELGSQINIDTTNPSFNFISPEPYPKQYFFNWQLAEKFNGHHMREDDPFIQGILEKAYSRKLNTTEIAFDYKSYPKKISVLENLKVRSGWLELNLLEIDTFEKEEFLLFSAITDDGEVVPQEVCEKMFQLPGKVINAIDDVTNLDEIYEQLQSQSLKKVEERISNLYELEVEKLEAWSDDLKIGLERQLKDLEKELKDAKKASKSAKTLSEKLEHQKKIKNLENLRTQKRRTLYSEQDLIEERRDELINKLEKRVAPRINKIPVFKIRWKIS